MFVTRVSRYIPYSDRYDPQFNVTGVGLGTYYPWIRGHTCTLEVNYSFYEYPHYSFVNIYRSSKATYFAHFQGLFDISVCS
jgi:hypothetical protein